MPSDAEWTTLVNYAGGELTAGKKLKSASGWYDHDGVSMGNGTDEYGFSALPGGYGHSGRFEGADSDGTWWSATESGADEAWFRYVSYYGDIVDRPDEDKEAYRFSVRCVRN